MRLYVGNLPFKATEADLESWFSEAGVAVNGVNIMRDRFSGEARGFGFAEIADEQEAARKPQPKACEKIGLRRTVGCRPACDGSRSLRRP
ncbi:MAG: hypothetical protein ABSD56_13310 [Bryobacteraceae bacterium]